MSQSDYSIHYSYDLISIKTVYECNPHYKLMHFQDIVILKVVKLTDSSLDQT